MTSTCMVSPALSPLDTTPELGSRSHDGSAGADFCGLSQKPLKYRGLRLPGDHVSARIMAFASLFRSQPKGGGKILVAFASQTGAAERIAWLSANALASSGSFVRVEALGGLAAPDLA